MNIYKIYLILALIAANSCFQSRAAVSFINYDRIWEYRGYCSSTGGRVYHKMKYIGTKTINNKEYHGFARINTIKTEWDENLQNDILVSEEIYEDDGRKYFVREEDDQKLYSLIEETEDGGWKRFYSTTQPLTHTPAPHNGYHHFSEVLLYDGSIINGGEINLPMSFRDSFNSEETLFQFIGEIVSIDNEDCKLAGYYYNHTPIQYPTIEHWHTSQNAWIEGIGILGNGCLASYEIEQLMGIAYDSSDILTQTSTLRSVYSTDGFVLYGDQPFIASGVSNVKTADFCISRNAGAVTISGNGQLAIELVSIDATIKIASKGLHQTSISTTDLPKGVYIIFVSDGMSTHNVKIAI